MFPQRNPQLEVPNIGNTVKDIYILRILLEFIAIQVNEDFLGTWEVQGLTSSAKNYSKDTASKLSHNFSPVGNTGM